MQCVCYNKRNKQTCLPLVSVLPNAALNDFLNFWIVHFIKTGRLDPLQTETCSPSFISSKDDLEMAQLIKTLNRIFPFKSNKNQMLSLSLTLVTLR